MASDNTSKIAWNPDKPKRQTCHIKGIAPKIEKRKSGETKIEFIQDGAKRRHCLSQRKEGLFKKARELSIMTGKNVDLTVGQEFWSSATGEEQQEATTSNEVEPSYSKVTQDDPAMIPKHLQVTVTEIRQRSVGVQCSDGTPLHAGGEENDRQCRLCGKIYAEDPPKVQDLWIACENESCNYWLHATCLLGPSKKIKKDFVRNLPFLCNVHRK